MQSKLTYNVVALKGKNGIPISPIPAVNVASVPQRSPLRYPGGKTWLVPHIRAWLGSFEQPPPLLVEPFAGGGTVSLTAVMEGLADHCLMTEIDHDVAAFWHAVIHHGPALCDRILRFQPTRAAVENLLNSTPTDVLEHGFRTLVLNRTRRGGILAPGASLSRTGENGKGIASRWYSWTIARRIKAIGAYADRIRFCETDGLAFLKTIVEISGTKIAAFIDPPYTAGGKRAGRRLYAHNDIDHSRLFQILDDGNIEFLMTYDQSPEILALVRRHRFHAVQVLMKNTHHAQIPEIVITPKPVFDR